MNIRTCRRGCILSLALLCMLMGSINIASPSTTHQSYRLGPNDIVRVQVYGEEDLTVESKIDGDGNINFPLLGVVSVAGKTLQELQEYLTAQLAGGYVRAPKVTAYVFKYRNFYVSGEVKAPGGYPYEEGLSLQKALTMAGGVTEKAERNDVRILRSINGQQETMHVKPESPVLPDDTIIVPEGLRFYVSGEVKTPGRYLYEKGLTVHKALSMVGGRTEKAERGLIKITRVADGVAETLVVTPDATVLPDDIIVAEPQDHKFYVSGEVKNSGGYPYKEGLTVHKAVAMAGGLTEKAERGDVHILRSADGREATIVAKSDSLVLPDDTIVVMEGQRFYISGEVKTPGRYLYEKGLTVYKAISVAGGRTEKAENGVIKVTRLVDGVAQTVMVTADAAVLPDDTIVVVEGERFYVSGEVRTPGRYLYEKGMTVHKALTLAGGRTEKAEKGIIKMTRLTEGMAETLVVNGDAAVLPDDIIMVEPHDYKFYTSGEVKSPGGYPYKEGLTIHKAIAMAGGLTEKAGRGKFQVLRQINGHEETVTVGLDSLLLPDDIIVVPEGQRIYVSGEVKTAGRYVYEQGMTIHKALSLAGGRTERAEKGSLKLTRIASGVAETVAATPETVMLPDDILVVEADNHKFYVSGEVKNPSGYPYKEGLTVHKAIAMAGGLTEKAERGKFQVLRQVNSHEETVPVGLDSLVLPDDILVVTEGQKFHIGGEVKAPGRYLYEKGVTVHKAVSMAGGWTEKAEKEAIKVIRMAGDVRQSIDVDLDDPLLPNDFLVVPQLRKVYVNGEVKRAGDYPYERGLTVHKVITMAGGFTDKAAESSTKVIRKVNGQEQSLQVKLETIILPEDILVVPRSFF